MKTQYQITMLAAKAHRKIWSKGANVSLQTKKSQRVCAEWQKKTLALHGKRLEAEVPLDGTGRSQKIDLVDWKTRTAYELKSSPNNVHMEIYRDVFKALVFNRRNPRRAIKTMVFIAPKAGMGKLGPTFPKDVQAIARGLKLKLILAGI